jgi:hypothetical protein
VRVVNQVIESLQTGSVAQVDSQGETPYGRLVLGRCSEGKPSTRRKSLELLCVHGKAVVARLRAFGWCRAQCNDESADRPVCGRLEMSAVPCLRRDALWVSRCSGRFFVRRTLKASPGGDALGCSRCETALGCDMKS